MLKLIFLNVFLLLSAYFLVEKSEITNRSSSLTRDYIITPQIFGELDNIQIRNFSMKKKDKLWEGKNSISIDREKVSRFLRCL